VTIQEHLREQVQEQSKEEMGGCGPICKQFDSVASLMEPTVQRLYTIYDPEDDAKDLKGHVHEIRNTISNLLADGDQTPEEARMPLRRIPKRPNRLHYFQRFVKDQQQDWRPYLFMEPFRIN